MSASLSVSPASIQPSLSITSDGRSGERVAIAQFEGLLLQAAFAPIAKAMGFYGDIMLGTVMRGVMRVPER